VTISCEESAADRFASPMPVSDLDLAFGGKVEDLMPPYREIPETFRNWNERHSKLAGRWFYEGIDKNAIKAKAGIDESAAWKHMAAIMSSWAPKHEHKMAGVAYLMSRWFDIVQEAK
jgi:hypothetical protein